MFLCYLDNPYKRENDDRLTLSSNCSTPNSVVFVVRPLRMTRDQVMPKTAVNHFDIFFNHPNHLYVPTYIVKLTKTFYIFFFNQKKLERKMSSHLIN